MILFALAYLGGVLTIASPCILPVLPFVFARADQPWRRSGLPLLAGMALSFAAFATLAAVAGSWAVDANRYGRGVAMGLLALFGLTLLFPSIADRVMQPLVRLGGRLSNLAETPGDKGPGVASSLLLGLATGLLWAPCAGPILGLILTGAALQGASLGTTVLLLAYAAGAATSLALALRVGGRVLAAMKRSLGAGEWVRRILGVAVLAGVAAIALGLDTGLLTRLSSKRTASFEQGLLEHLRPSGTGAAQTEYMQGQALPVEGTLPGLTGAVEWLNSPALSPAQLRGKVVLVDFWTYSCINCLRSLPYVRAWADKYRDQGLVVIGVHTPEFAFEKDVGNVRKALADLGITYPVAVDNEFAIWTAFNNNFWPAHYFVDVQGRIRHHHFGEGSYDSSERVIQQLLAEAGRAPGDSGLVRVQAQGAQAASDYHAVETSETYVGYTRARDFVSKEGFAKDQPRDYRIDPPTLNHWGLVGNWTVAAEQAGLNDKDGGIVYRFKARDLHLVLGPGPDGKAVRFRITLDGAAPGESGGVDVGADGAGIVTGQRLYQLVRQAGSGEHTFEIRFLDAGVQAYAFTFG